MELNHAVAQDRDWFQGNVVHHCKHCRATQSDKIRLHDRRLEDDISDFPVNGRSGDLGPGILPADMRNAAWIDRLTRPREHRVPAALTDLESPRRAAIVMGGNNV